MPLKRSKRKRDSLKMEKVVASEFGGKVQPASGSLWSRKGDFIVGRKLIGECKGTKFSSIRFKYSWLTKLQEVALKSGRYPLVVLSFGGEKKPQVVCLLYEDFAEILTEGRI